MGDVCELLCSPWFFLGINLGVVGYIMITKLFPRNYVRPIYLTSASTSIPAMNSIDDIWSQFYICEDHNQMPDVFNDTDFVPKMTSNMRKLESKFDDFGPVYSSFCDLYNYVMRGCLSSFEYNTKSSIEIHYGDDYGETRKIVLWEDDFTIILPMTAPEKNMESSVRLVKAYVDAGISFICDCDTPEDDDHEEESEEKEEEEEEGGDQPVPGPTITAVEWTDDESNSDPSYNEEEEEEEGEQEEYSSGSDPDASETLSEEIRKYQADFTFILSPWLRYPSDNLTRLMPFILRDIIAADKELYDFMSRLAYMRIILEYSDGSKKTAIIDEYGVIVDEVETK